jgi:hypothetical protein
MAGRLGSGPALGPPSSFSAPTSAVIPAKAGIHPGSERDMRGFPLSRE